MDSCELGAGRGYCDVDAMRNSFRDLGDRLATVVLPDSKRCAYAYSNRGVREYSLGQPFFVTITREAYQDMKIANS